MKKLSLFTIIILFIISCSSNEPYIVTNPISDVTISGYKITSEAIATNGGSPNFKKISIGNLLNGKLFSITTENFSAGVSLGLPVTTQEHFYNGNLLVAYISGTRKTDFYYDSQNRLIGAKLTLNFNNPLLLQGYNYYRFTHISNSIVYFEKTSLPYNDPSLVVSSRNILEFDTNDNLIKVGGDANFDGISENQKQFTYFNNNIVTSQIQGQAIINYTYSDVIDTFAILNEKSFGKKNLRIICSEVSTFFNAIETQNLSKQLLSQEVIDNNYEVLSNNYYKKKTKLINFPQSNYTESIITEFFFN